MGARGGWGKSTQMSVHRISYKLLVSKAVKRSRNSSKEQYEKQNFDSNTFISLYSYLKSLNLKDYKFTLGWKAIAIVGLCFNLQEEISKLKKSKCIILKWNMLLIWFFLYIAVEKTNYNLFKKKKKTPWCF